MIETSAITMDRAEAARLYRKYREHRAWSKPVDHEIERVYGLIAKGHVAIKALDSIRAAGVDAAGYPKLAIARADAKACWLEISQDGSASMASLDRWTYRTAPDRLFRFERGTFPGPRSRWRARAIAPHIPPDLRPKRGLQNYHILWEADWETIPVDPILLRRVGKTGDLWIVLGAWELTQVERAVLAGQKSS